MHVAVLVVDGAFDSGLAAVLDVLDTANSLRAQLERPPQAWITTVLGVARTVRTGAGHSVPAVLREELPAMPDLLVVPALGVKEPAALIEVVSSPRRAAVRRLIQDARTDGVELAGACTGTFFLAEAGVLDGLRATTSWWLGPAFRQRYPAVVVEESRTLVCDDRVTTAGAAFAHIDLALSFVQAQSPVLADLVARYLLIGDRRSQATFAVPAVLAQHNPVMAAFERWVRHHLAEPIRIADAARSLSVSDRTLQRTTAATMGMSPVDFINEIRLDHATFLIRTTTLTADAIASRVGYQNPGTLRSLIRRRRGMTVRELRHGGATP